jgi:integrase
MYELWEGVIPVIPVNNYFRAHPSWSTSTLASKAYQLIHFFRFLKRNSLSFWMVRARSAGPVILQFRNELLLRARMPKDYADSPSQNSDEQVREVSTLTHSAAKSILAEVGLLCEWWRQSGEAPIIRGAVHYGNRGRGRFPRNAATLPASFTIIVPAKEKYRTNHVLEPSEVSAIWDYLTLESRPAMPTLLKQHSRYPPSGWSQNRKLTWQKIHDKYRTKLAWVHRQQMLWALMIGSAMRHGEVPLLMSVDVHFYGDDLWVALRVRTRTEHLGRAKTGPRTIFIGWDSRIIAAWQNWTRSRQVLVDKWMSLTGQPDHEMFLTNRDGSPLTTRGMQSLFSTLKARFGCFGGPFVEDQFQIHPHAVRHTVESLFQEWGIPHHVRQRHLGHKKPETTDLYGKVYRKTYINYLSAIDARNLNLSGVGD